MSENTNVKATITIYKKCILNPEKNFALDSGGASTTAPVEYYLYDLESQTITDVNYQKHGLTIELKLDKNQAGLEMGVEDKDWNYMKIQNGSEKPVYYFITNKEWRAKETIKFFLTMDTLNTFKYNSDYVINKKTMIMRQHKDRMKKVQGYARGTEQANSMTAVISPKNSILTGPLVFGNDLTPVEGAVRYLVIVKFVNENYPDLQLPYDNYFTVVNEETGSWGILVNTAFSSGYPSSGTSMEANVYPLFNLYEREIDLYSEGINAPVYKTELGKLIDKNDDLTWYLLYRNTQQQGENDYVNNSPVEAFLIPEEPRSVHVSSAKNLTTTELTSSYYLFHANMNPNASFLINGSKYTPSRTYKPRTTWEYENINDYYLVLHISGGTITFEWWQYRVVFYPNGSVKSENYWLKATGTTANVTFESSANEVHALSYATDPHTLVHDYAIPSYNKTFSFTGGSNYQLNSVGAVDRTDSRNIKLLALPYCPANISLINGHLNFDENFSYDSTTGWMKVNNIATKFENFLQFDMTNPFENLFLQGFSPSAQVERNDYYESKLYHSDFFRYKFIYDSFSRIYELEKYDFESYFEERYKDIPVDTISFVMTRTINSKFLFKFDTTYLVHSTEDYDGVCCVSRNNEEPLYNSAYINYIRAGYNYDKKSIARTREANQLGIGIAVASALAGIIGSIATSNPGPAILSVVGAGIGIASQYASMVRTTAQGEQAIQQKLDESARQAVSVAGSDDIDLLTAYSGNRAKFVLYDVSERMKKALGDLFYYCGYKIDVQGIPNNSSRYWFNFVQAELVIDDTSNLPMDIEDDIKARFSQGVTFFHYRGSYGFNLAQDKENCEVSLLNL